MTIKSLPFTHVFICISTISWSDIRAWTIPTNPAIIYHDRFLNNKNNLEQKSQISAISTQLRMIWPFDNQESIYNTETLLEEKDKLIKIGKEVGRGSYGQVHLCKFHNGNTQQEMIAKRALTEEEIKEKLLDNDFKGDDYDPCKIKNKAREKLTRCNYYFNVEKHCFEKIQNDESKLPKYFGTFYDVDDNLEWMVFSLIEGSGSNIDFLASRPAITLGQAIKKDWIDQHKQENRHHLSIIQDELGLKESTTFEETLDTIFLTLLQTVSHVHKYNIVHRDIKPDNLLCNPKTNSLVLIDFGSAADIDQPSSSNNFFKKRVGLDDDSVVAISPIYSAPELFIKNDNTKLSNTIAFNFDTFSCALIFLQLLFNLLDERTDAAFRQQLEMEAKYDLDAWFANELSSTIRPVGLEDGLNYLSSRPGLWKLLKAMVLKDPEKRISVFDSLQQFKIILRKKDLVSDKEQVEELSFFESVMEAYDQCDIEDFNLMSFLDDDKDFSIATSRPLHYIATFQRSLPLGLVLSEVDFDTDGDSDEDLQWTEATKGAKPGEVYIKEIVSMGQAYKMGIFEIGDRLQAVGEIPIYNGGFEKAVQLLSSQPKSSKSVTLHFDRKSITRSTSTTVDDQKKRKGVKILQEGAWSTKGRYRKTNEDAYILNEIHQNANDENGFLVAGVFDGHGGEAASTSVAQLLPNLIADETTAITTPTFKTSTQDLKSMLKSCWENVCQTYQEGCILYDNGSSSCIANYDPINGVVYARTGSSDLIAGTTAVIAFMSMNYHDHTSNDDLILLNCGDSRALLIARPESEQESVIQFATKDHSPSCESEMKRLKEGKSNGLDYSIPECSLNRWRIKVGDYQYAVSRSLEGTFATSKGIIYDPDISIISLSEKMKSSSGILILASDGLFEVMDNEEVGLDLLAMREKGLSASDAAKKICNIALEKGSKDNVSAVVVYFD